MKNVISVKSFVDVLSFLGYWRMIEEKSKKKAPGFYK